LSYTEFIFGNNKCQISSSLVILKACHRLSLKCVCREGSVEILISVFDPHVFQQNTKPLLAAFKTENRGKSCSSFHLRSLGNLTVAAGPWEDAASDQ